MADAAQEPDAVEMAHPTDELVGMIHAYLAARFGRDVPFAIITWDAPMAQWASNVPAEEVSDIFNIVAVDLAARVSPRGPDEVRHDH